MAASARVRFLRWLAITLAVMTVIAGAAILVGQRVLRERVELARERMKSEPPAAPGFARLEGEDPTAWLLAIENAEPQEEIEVPAECAGSEEDARDTLDGMWTRLSAWNLAEPDVISGCTLAIQRTLVASTAAQLELARQTERYGPVQLPEIPSEIDDFSRLAPAHLSEAMKVVGVLVDSAALAAAQGDAQRAIQDLRLAFRGIGIIDERDGTTNWLCVRHTEGLFLGAVTRLAHWLDPAIDLSEFQALLQGMDPWPAYEAALRADRTLYVASLDAVRRSFAGSLTPGPMLLGLEAWVDHEETLLLDAFSAGLVAARAHIAPPEVEPFEPRPWNAMFSMMAPPLQRNHETVLRNEARRLLTLGVLIARKDGPEAAEAWAAGQIDPFAAGPMRTQLDVDVLRIWSVGPNGVSDGGDSVNPDGFGPPPDLVVSIRVR